MEGRLADLICYHIPFVDSVQFLNTGSEATYQALRLARAATGRDHIIVMQGGYNGWHNDVACNLMTPLEQLGPRQNGLNFLSAPISAGIPKGHSELVHPVSFNDLESVRAICEKYSCRRTDYRTSPPKHRCRPSASGISGRLASARR